MPKKEKILKKLSVGQSIFVLAETANNDLKYRIEKIKKVGREYFELDSTKYCRFFIKTMIGTSYNYPKVFYKCFSTLDEMEKYNRRKILIKKLNYFFDVETYTLSLDKLEAINNIIEED
jgi:hypothetical protein